MFRSVAGGVKGVGVGRAIRFATEGCPLEGAGGGLRGEGCLDTACDDATGSPTTGGGGVAVFVTGGFGSRGGGFQSATLRIRMGPFGFCGLGSAVALGGVALEPEPALDDWASVLDPTFLTSTNGLAPGGEACDFSPSRFRFSVDTRDPSVAEGGWVVGRTRGLLGEPGGPKRGEPSLELPLP